LGLDGGILDDAAALAQMQRALPDREDAPRGIRVNAVGPGPIGTPFASKLGLPEDALRQSGEALAATVPFSGLGTRWKWLKPPCSSPATTRRMRRAPNWRSTAAGRQSGGTTKRTAGGSLAAVAAWESRPRQLQVRHPRRDGCDTCGNRALMQSAAAH
jgi:hypothetical protein